MFTTTLQRTAIVGVCALAIVGCGSSTSGTSASSTTQTTSTSAPSASGGMSGMSSASPSAMGGMSSASSTGSAGGMASSSATPGAASPTFASTHLDPLQISDGYAFATTSGMTDMSAAYVTVHNTGTSATALVSASTSAASMTQLHMTTDNGSGGGTMKQVSSLPIGAGQTLVLKPGGNHIMMMGLKHPLAAGSSIPVTLRFRDGKQVTLTVPVIDRSQRPGA